MPDYRIDEGILTALGGPECAETGLDLEGLVYGYFPNTSEHAIRLGIRRLLARGAIVPVSRGWYTLRRREGGIYGIGT